MARSSGLFRGWCYDKGEITQNSKATFSFVLGAKIPLILYSTIRILTLVFIVVAVFLYRNLCWGQLGLASHNLKVFILPNLKLPFL